MLLKCVVVFFIILISGCPRGGVTPSPPIGGKDTPRQKCMGLEDEAAKEMILELAGLERPDFLGEHPECKDLMADIAKEQPSKLSFSLESVSSVQFAPFQSAVYVFGKEITTEIIQSGQFVGSKFSGLEKSSDVIALFDVDGQLYEIVMDEAGKSEIHKKGDDDFSVVLSGRALLKKDGTPFMVRYKNFIYIIVDVNVAQYQKRFYLESIDLDNNILYNKLIETPINREEGDLALALVEEGEDKARVYFSYFVPYAGSKLKELQAGVAPSLLLVKDVSFFNARSGANNLMVVIEAMAGARDVLYLSGVDTSHDYDVVLGYYDLKNPMKFTHSTQDDKMQKPGALLISPSKIYMIGEEYTNYSGYLRIYDRESKEMEEEISIGYSPRELIFEEDNLYILNVGSKKHLDEHNSTVSVVDIKDDTAEIKEIDLGVNSQTLRILSVNNYLAFYGPFSDTLRILNKKTQKLSSAKSGDKSSDKATFTINGDFLYASSFSGDSYKLSVDLYYMGQGITPSK